MKRRDFLACTTATLAAGRVLAEPAATPEGKPLLSFGILTDPQYCDADPLGERHYRETPAKLRAAVADLAGRKLPFTLQLGDFIDRDFASYAKLLPVLDGLGHPVRHLLGNHDYTVADDRKSRVVQTLDLPHDYYGFHHGPVRFLMLDTNAISTYKAPAGSAEAKAGEEALGMAKEAKQAGAQPWNGGVGTRQLEWLDRELTAAGAAGDIVIVCGHHPVLPVNNHQLWDADELLAVIERHACVKAYFNGHNHDGAFAEHKGIPCVTFRSILQKPGVNAWAVVHVYRDRLMIDGHGREESRELKFAR